MAAGLLDCFLSGAGQGAPRATQRRSVAMFASDSRFLGGILGSPRYRTARISKLSSGLPGTTAGPLSPPFNIASRSVRFSPFFDLTALWHGWQRSKRSGRTSFSKNSIASGSSASEGDPSPHRTAQPRKKDASRPGPRPRAITSTKGRRAWRYLQDDSGGKHHEEAGDDVCRRRRRRGRRRQARRHQSRRSRCVKDKFNKFVTGTSSLYRDAT